MRLNELFDNPPLHMEDKIRQLINDTLTPLLVHNVEYVTIDQLIRKLQTSDLGLIIDKQLIMDILVPGDGIVKKIDGEKIYINVPEIANRSVDDDTAEKEKKHVSDMATKQALKSIKEK